MIFNPKDIIVRTFSKFFWNSFSRYRGIFLTFACNHNCNYCIQGKTRRSSYKTIDGIEWIKILKSKELKIAYIIKPTLSLIGGEPTLHKDFKMIVEALYKYYNIVVTTNLNSPIFKDFDNFLLWAKRYPVNWAASYHFKQMDVDTFLNRIKKMKYFGLKVKAFCVNFNLDPVIYKKLNSLGYDIFFQTLMGVIDGKLYPKKEFLHKFGLRETGINDYEFYKEGFSSNSKKRVLCKINKVLINPEGNYYRCHYHLYNKIDSLGNIFKENISKLLKKSEKYIPCDHFGFCNPCDYANVNIK